MAKHGVPDDIVLGWTAGAVASKAVRQDLTKYATTPVDKAEMVAATQALARFERPALVVWGTEDKVMPPEHGRRIATLLPQGRLIEVDDAYVLLPEDQPALLANELRQFLAST